MIYFITLTETDGDPVAIEVRDHNHLRYLIHEDPSGMLIDGQIIPLGEAQQRLCHGQAIQKR